MGLFSKFVAKVKGGSNVSAQDWQELESELLSADLGPKLASIVIEAAKTLKGDDAKAGLTQILNSHLSEKSRLIANPGFPSAIVIVGVNGTGKTTSAAKLANFMVQDSHSVVLAAADTFRAAAVDQLQTWGGRIGVTVITGKDGADPASVAFDAATCAKESGVDYLIIDTAGRLQNKSDLIAELGKVRRVIEKSLPVSEVLLVIDATTGQNGLAQAKVFADAVAVTGLVLTKLDGSARGGVALAIESSLDIPIKFVGIGEGIENFAPFDAQRYLSSLTSE